MLPVTSWSCPTHVIVGAGSARAYLQALDKPFVVCDPAVEIGADLVRQPHMTDADFITAIQSRPAGTTVVAVGGGSVLDPARVAVAGLPITGQGVVGVPSAPTAGCDIVCVPSTIGTAAEVSPVAVLQAGALMLISPALRARVAVLDPDVTANPDEQGLRLGLIEPWARVVVPAVAGDGLLLQDALAGCLARVIEQLMTEPITSQWRLTAALTSAQTHTAFVALQRSPFSHVVWPVAMEYAAMAGLSKQNALARLLPVWLRSQGQHGLAATVQELWPADHPTVDPDSLSERVAQRWSGFQIPDPRSWLGPGL